MATERSELADLHCHTLCSDGMLSPEDLVRAAHEAGLSAVAITDHDSLDGIEPARRAAESLELQFVAGIELSTRCASREVHLLGLFVDPMADVLREFAGNSRRSRHHRAEQIVSRAARLGLTLRMQDLERVAAGAPIGRPHVAAALVDSGAVVDSQAAFDRLLGVGRPLFVPRELPPTAEAIDAVHAAGGVAVVAHPGSSRVRSAALNDLARQGLDGIEVRHPKHGRERERILLQACQRLGLLPSGGSDYHGPGRGDSRVGSVAVPMPWYRALRDRAQRRSERT